MEEIKLTAQEELELQDGMAIEEMTKGSGFRVLKEWLEDMAFHSWMDPREAPSKEEWEWRELNAFHAANTARELLERFQQAISRSDMLQAKKRGELKVTKMDIGR